MTIPSKKIQISSFKDKLTGADEMQVALELELSQRVVHDYIHGRRHSKSTKVAILAHLKENYSDRLNGKGNS